MENKKKFEQQEIVNYLKNYGFVYANSEIYNGLANAWDFGNLGSLLKKNIKDAWTNFFIFSQKNMILLDSAIIYNSDVWKASGHLANFSDPLIDCKECKNRFRADKLIEEFCPNEKISENTDYKILLDIINKNKVKCPNCQKINWTDIRNFNLMFKTFQGVLEDSASTLYLRPETAQGIFINFKNLLRTSRQKIPFGVGQIGKAFRNEITPGNFIFRTREFEQMEIEFFVKKEQSNEYFNFFEKKLFNFFVNVCNFNEKSLRIYNHPKESLSHYSSKTIDFEYNFPHGWGELCGLADRGNYDLTVHQELSKKDLTYFDQNDNEKFLPNVIEPSMGVERLFYAIVCEHYHIEEVDNDTREVLKLPIKLSPYKLAILPLVNKLKDDALSLYENIIKKFNISIDFDASGTIGKRYRRQDAIGTKYCITFDFDSPEKGTITIRERDTMKQETLKIDELDKFIIDKIILV